MVARVPTAAAGITSFVLCAGSIACGELATEPRQRDLDAGAADGGVSLDASDEDVTSFGDTAPTPFDAGTVDGGDVRCGESVCRTPDEFCCVGAMDGAVTYECKPSSTIGTSSCIAYAFCDDVGDCSVGVCCMAESFSPLIATCTTRDCSCNGIPNCWEAELCDPDAGVDECPLHHGGACRIDAGAVSHGYAFCR